MGQIILFVVLIGGFTILGIFLWKSTQTMFQLNKEFKELKVITIHSFGSLKEDMYEIKKTIKTMDQKFDDT
jgi:hypothetical protein